MKPKSDIPSASALASPVWSTATTGTRATRATAPWMVESHPAWSHLNINNECQTFFYLYFVSKCFYLFLFPVLFLRIHNPQRIWEHHHHKWSRTDQTELGEQQQMQTLGVDDEQDHDETPRDDLEENENEFKIRIRIKLAKFRYIPNIPPPLAATSLTYL